MTEAIKHRLDLDSDSQHFDLFAEEMSLAPALNLGECCASTIATASTVSCPSSYTTLSSFSSECCS